MFLNFVYFIQYLFKILFLLSNVYLKTRLEEHNPITFGKSDVTDHLQENPHHTIDFHNPLILAQETNWRKLRIKETLYIQKLQPQLNSDEASHPLYLFNV